MSKDLSLFSSLDFGLEKNIFLVDDFALDIVGHGDVQCWRGQAIDMFHVPSLIENILSVSKPKQIENIVELWPDQLFIKN